VSVCGPVFRYDRVRRGFLREFHQVGVEMLGDGPAADVEVIWLAWQSLADLGMRHRTVHQVYVVFAPVAQMLLFAYVALGYLVP